MTDEILETKALKVERDRDGLTGVGNRLEDTLKDKMRLMLGLDAKIQLVSPNTLQRFEGKAKRVTDLRKEV